MMINKIWIFLLTIMAPMYLCRCSKHETPTVVHKGVVLYNVCGNVVIQSEGPGSRIGENGWTDSNDPSRPVYDHVFRVSNACDFGMHSHGDTVSFVITTPRQEQCMQCEIYVATPATSYPIRVVK